MVVVVVVLVVIADRYISRARERRDSRSPKRIRFVKKKKFERFSLTKLLHFKTLKPQKNLEKK